VERESQLRDLALSLRCNTPYFSSGWNIRFLQAFIRDGGICVYCKRDVMSELCIACGDHLLPRRRYPQLIANVDNIVAACTNCNRIKADFDPSNAKGNEIGLTAKTRKTLIQASKEEIDRRKSVYARDYETGVAAFKEAISRYRELPSS
jgi:hypothetical protein